MLIQSDRHVATQCSPRRRGTHLLCAGLLVAASAAVWGVELPAQGAARSTSPQQERADLRREVTELRSELRSLKSVLRRFARTRAPVADEARNPLASATPPEPAIPGSAGTRQPAPPNPLVAAEPIAVAPSIGLPASPAVDVLPDPGMAPRASGASGQSLMALATQRIELSGEIDVAAARLNLIERRAAEGAVDKTEVEVAQIEMNTLQRKSHLLDQMIDAELDACRFEMARLDKRMAVTEQLAKNGYVSADEPAEIEANYRRLRATYKLLKATR